MKNKNGQAAKYIYNGLGHRVVKSVTGSLGKSTMNSIGNVAAGSAVAAGVITIRGSYTQVYRMANTRLINGTWKIGSLSLKTWGKSIASEFTHSAFTGFSIPAIDISNDYVIDPLLKILFSSSKREYCFQ